MFASDRFALQPMQVYSQISNAPVSICCSRQCTEIRSGVNFLQLRMCNRSDRFVCSVFLTIEGFREGGNRIFQMREVVVPQCNAKSGAVFGEERMIAIEKVAKTIEVTVERVVFDDGMIWCKSIVYHPKVQAPAQEYEPACVCLGSKTEKLPAVQASECAKQTLPQMTKIPSHNERGMTAPLDKRQKTRPAPIIRESLPTLCGSHKKRKRGNALLIWILIVGIIVLAIAVALIFCKDGNCSLLFQ